jgi:hypothetical protein
METDSLRVDLSDPEDVRRALPLAEAIVKRKEAVLDEAQNAFNLWLRHFNYLKSVAGEQQEGAGSQQTPEPDTSPNGSASGKADRSPSELVIEVVNREVRRIRAREVHAILASEGHDLDKAAVSNALYYAASVRGGERIKQVGRGWYAPLALPPPTDYAVAAAHGFPVPEHLPETTGQADDEET